MAKVYFRAVGAIQAEGWIVCERTIEVGDFRQLVFNEILPLLSGRVVQQLKIWTAEEGGAGRVQCRLGRPLSACPEVGSDERPFIVELPAPMGKYSAVLCVLRSEAV